MGSAPAVSDGTNGRLARGGLRNRDNRPTVRNIRVSYLNTGKRKEALEELKRVRPLDDILIIGEVPVRDNRPIRLDGFYAIYHEIDPDTEKPLRVYTYVGET